MLQNIVLLVILGMFAYQDYRKRKVSLFFLLASAICGIMFELCLRLHTIGDVVSGMGIGAALLIVAVISRERVGIGDGLIMVVTGMFLGFAGNLKLFLTSLLLIGTAALILLILKRKEKNDQIPFGPFLFGGYF